MKPSGKIKTYTVHQRQKNGDIYVLELTMRYDPERKNSVILGTKLVPDCKDSKKEEKYENWIKRHLQTCSFDYEKSLKKPEHEISGV